MPLQVPKAIGLLSGGLDSAIACLLAQDTDCDFELLITLDYGQRAAQREIESAKKIAEYLKAPHQTIEVPWYKENSGSLLDSSQTLPKLSLVDLDNTEKTKESAKSVWVPNRNGLFIEIAALFAEQRQAKQIIVGFNREEAATFPDNSQAYLVAITHALSFSTSNRVQVLSPTLRMNKAEIVAEAIARNFPLEILWSCYEGGAAMCGRCESCQRFKRALASQGVKDADYFQHPELH